MLTVTYSVFKRLDVAGSCCASCCNARLGHTLGLRESKNAVGVFKRLDVAGCCVRLFRCASPSVVR